MAGDAAAEGSASTDARPEIVAWYHTLVGALAFQDGDIEASEAAYRAALDAWEGSAAALAGLARATAARDDLEGAIALYRGSLAILPRPEILASLGDLQWLTGDEAGARSTWAKVAQVARLTPSDRQISLFLANHQRDAVTAVALARRDLEVRHDAYAHDAVAWALLGAGDVPGAEAEIALARAAGTQDPLLDYHAGMVAAAAGRTGEARELLGDLLDRFPGFDPLQANRARATLATLEARP
jgi:tetratricopeptide (TPR) repeat protein